MFQKGRGEQPVKYKSEVLKLHPKAKWVYRYEVGLGAIMNGDERISKAERAAWKAWEDAYYKIKK